MAEQNFGEVELPLDTVGRRLQRAREAAGLSRGDIAARTRIAERHLAAIEENRFGDLVSSTYAVGFSRTYARAVGLDEIAVANQVRAELAGVAEEPRHSGATFEPGDPARVPPSRMAWLAGLVALGVIGAVFLLWRSYFDPAVALPDLTTEEAPAAPASAAASGLAPATVAPGGPVVFTAQAEGVWVKFYDAAGKQLMQKEMALGESYIVPADAQGPQIWTARPDALSITVAGRPVPPLSDQQMTMRNVPVTAAALLARGTAPAVAEAAAQSVAVDAAVPPVAQPDRPASRSAVTPPRAAAPTPGPTPTPDSSTPAAVETSTVSN